MDRAISVTVKQIYGLPWTLHGTQAVDEVVRCGVRDQEVSKMRQREKFDCSIMRGEKGEVESP